MTEIVLYKYDQILTACGDIAMQLNRDFRNKEIYVVPVMEGGLVFAGHLVPMLTGNVQVMSVRASSYDKDSQGHLTTNVDIDIPKASIVILVDDIIDSGNTLEALVNQMETQELTPLTCVLLNKNVATRQIQPDYWGLPVNEDHFVWGFGLDTCGMKRNSFNIHASDRRVHKKKYKGIDRRVGLHS